MTISESKKKYSIKKFDFCLNTEAPIDQNKEKDTPRPT